VRSQIPGPSRWVEIMALPVPLAPQTISEKRTAFLVFARFLRNCDILISRRASLVQGLGRLTTWVAEDMMLDEFLLSRPVLSNRIAMISERTDIQRSAIRYGAWRACRTLGRTPGRGLFAGIYRLADTTLAPVCKVGTWHKCASQLLSSRPASVEIVKLVSNLIGS
jgi:hypothetical protein